MTTCKNCNEPITWEPEAGGYWYHTNFNQVWCWGKDDSLPPEKWHLTAEPKDNKERKEQ